MVLNKDFFAGAASFLAAKEETTRPLEAGANAEADARQARVTTAAVFMILIEDWD
jgi:hypothetical protein